MTNHRVASPVATSLTPVERLFRDLDEDGITLRYDARNFSGYPELSPARLVLLNENVEEALPLMATGEATEEDADVS